MARRDVDLVIRARDEAKGALNAVTQALDKFSGAQQETQTVSEKTDSQLDRLGASFAELQKRLKGLTVGGTIDQELKRAENAIKRLEASTREAAGEAIGYQREARKSARATAELRAEADRVDAALKAQEAAVARNRRAQKALADATKNGAAAQQRYTRELQKLDGKIAEQSLRLENYRKRFRELQIEITNTAKPTAQVNREFQRTARNIERTEAKINDLTQTQRLISAETDRASRSIQRANDLYGQQANSVERSEKALESLTQKQGRLSTSLRAAAQEQGRLEAAAEKAANALGNQDAALERAEASYKEIQSAARETEGALSELEAQARGPLLRAFGEQAKRLKETEQSFKKNSAEAQRYAKELRATKQPSQELVQAFESYRAAAARGRQEIREQQRVLAELRGILRQTGGDLDTFRERQQQFAAALQRGEASFREYGNASQVAVQANERLVRSQNRAQGSTTRLAAASGRLANAQRTGARNTSIFASAIRQFYGESRTALSFTQRLRSEVLALVAAYGGFFAAIEGIRGVISSYQTLEATQSRLGAIFEQDAAAINNEIDFLRRNADRLGIELGSLADLYSKFAVATRGTNLEGQATRDIFISVAEAGRVNKLSLDQLRGTFLALEQMVSKGSVTMEELRRQLGDRLPGAFQIMANALDVTTAELSKMIENGEVSADVLTDFADQLDERFSRQLPMALQTTTTAIGRLQNALFQTFLRVGEGGAIEGFTDMVNTLVDTLQSAQFESFAARAGAALGSLFRVLDTLVANFDLVIIAITTFIGLKIAPFVVALVTVMSRLPAVLRLVRIRMFAAGQSVGAMSASMNGAAVATARFSRALRVLLSSTGIGLAVTLIGSAIGAWITSTEDATEALNTHKNLVDDVKNAYDEVGGAIDGVRENIEDMTAQQARANLRRLREEFNNILDDLDAAERRSGGSFATRFFGFNLGRAAEADFQRQAEGILTSLRQAEITAAEASEQFDALAESFVEGSTQNARYSEELDELLRRAVRFEEAIADAERIVRIKTGTDEEAAEAARELVGALEETGDAAEEAAERQAEFNSALEELRGFIPGVTEELERMKRAADLEDAFQQALRLAEGYEEMLAVFNAFQQARGSMENDAIFEGAASGGVGSAAALLREFEGFRSTPYWDVNALRAGYGSDTVTLDDGSVQQVTEGISVSVADANRDLIRRIGEFQDDIKGQIGETRFNQFDDRQQAALTSIAYNYGSLPNRIATTVREGTVEEIADAIRSLASDNEGINRDRRNREARIFQSGGAPSDQALIDAEEERLRLLERQREERERGREATQQTLDQQQFEIEQQNRLNAGQEREAAIQEAVRQAREQNANISEEELNLIRQRAGELFDLRQQEEEATTDKERAAEIEQEVNEILQLRNQLQQELNTLLENGGSAEAIEQTRLGLEGVNDQLRQAIDNALQMLSALDAQDPAVAAIISRMRELQLTSNQTANGMVISWSQVEKVFADKLTNAVMKFAEGIAEGKSVTESLRDAFLQFASDFLMQIARMIVQQLALNAAKAIGRAFGFGVAHEGGVIGASGVQRKVNPAVFAGAMRYHGGGLAGLRPGEVPTILERGEEVLTRDDPRHIFNGGGQEAGGAPEVTPRIVNAIDGASFLEEAIKEKRGQETLLNFISANRSTVRGSLGV